MSFRVTDSSQQATFTERVNTQRARVNHAQELLSSGRKINRPSDDPFGTDAVLRVRTSLANVEHFQQTASHVKDNLTIADVTLEGYEQLLDRARALLTQGASDSTQPAQKQSIATEIESIRLQALTIANRKSDERYLFGGTRQLTPPYDAAGIPDATPNQQQFVQLEPGAFPVAVDVTGEMVFANGASTIFAELSNAATALRGTGNPAADQTAVLTALDNVTAFSDRANSARAQIGASLHSVDEASNRLGVQALSYQEAAANIEGADFAAAALELSQADRDLQGTLQAISNFGRRSLLDFLS